MSSDSDLESPEGRVREQMTTVLDPCSCMTDSPVDIVELGLVDSIEISGETVEICLVPTTPMCTYMTQIIEDVNDAVRRLESVDEVHIEQDVKTIWTPERMSDELHQQWEANKPTMERPSPSSESGG